jgi:hypothetical protein
MAGRSRDKGGALPPGGDRGGGASGSGMTSPGGCGSSTRMNFPAPARTQVTHGSAWGFRPGLGAPAGRAGRLVVPAAMPPGSSAVARDGRHGMVCPGVGWSAPRGPVGISAGSATESGRPARCGDPSRGPPLRGQNKIQGQEEPVGQHQRATHARAMPPRDERDERDQGQQADPVREPAAESSSDAGENRTDSERAKDRRPPAQSPPRRPDGDPVATTSRHGPVSGDRTEGAAALRGFDPRRRGGRRRYPTHARRQQTSGRPRGGPPSPKKASRSFRTYSRTCLAVGGGQQSARDPVEPRGPRRRSPSGLEASVIPSVYIRSVSPQLQDHLVVGVDFAGGRSPAASRRRCRAGSRACRGAAAAGCARRRA